VIASLMGTALKATSSFPSMNIISMHASL